MNKEQDLMETENLFLKKYPLKDFQKLSDVKKRHRIVDIILNEHIYDAMGIFFYLIEKCSFEVGGEHGSG